VPSEPVVSGSRFAARKNDLAAARAHADVAGMADPNVRAQSVGQRGLPDAGDEAWLATKDPLRGRF